MTILQNAFSNTSSSLIQSKMHGNLTFVMLSPISPFEFYLAFVGASIVRGLAVGIGVLVVGIVGFDIAWQSPGWILLFAVLSAAIMGGVGMTAGILSDKYDHLAAFQNFIIIFDLLEWGVLFDSCLAGFLAGVFAHQSVLLYGGWIPLRFL